MSDATEPLPATNGAALRPASPPVRAAEALRAARRALGEAVRAVDLEPDPTAGACLLRLAGAIEHLCQGLQELLAQAPPGERWRDGYRDTRTESTRDLGPEYFPFPRP